MEQFDFTVSVVLYKTDEPELEKLLTCISLTSLSYQVYLIDNSPTDSLKKFGSFLNTIYQHNNANVGFGAGHNIAIKQIKNKSRYHLVVNADVTFEKNLMEELINFLNANEQYAHLMPKVLYPDGSIQYLCRNKPSLQNIFFKRLTPSFFQKKFSRANEYEFKNRNYNDFFFDVPFLSGCFMLFRTKALIDVGGFNESIFLYFEDADITQRILKKYRNVYYPLNFIYHSYKGTKNDLKLSFFAAIGLYKYFKTWGFFG